MKPAQTRSDEGGDAFVAYIDGLGAEGRAVLRRSLAFAPGTWPPAFRYVERWVGAGAGSWERRMTYLAAAMQALSRAERHFSDVGAAAQALTVSTGSQSVEARFLNLLDADDEQLPNRLRQMVSLMSSRGIAPEWSGLRKDLLRWRTEDRWVQQKWARSYYAPASNGVPPELNASPEEPSRTEQNLLGGEGIGMP